MAIFTSQINLDSKAHYSMWIEIKSIVSNCNQIFCFLSIDVQNEFSMLYKHCYLLLQFRVHIHFAVEKIQDF